MMESTQQRAEQATTPLKSAVGDLRRAKSAGSASVQELRKFLHSHRGKTSQELLGDLAQSSLLGAMIKSTLGCLALLTVLTVVPYFMQGKPHTAPANPAAAKNAPVDTSTTAAPATSPEVAQGKSSAKSTAPDGVDVDKAKKAMGLDETKTAPDNVNPREKDLDNLLDGVK